MTWAAAGAVTVGFVAVWLALLDDVGWLLEVWRGR